MAGKLESLNSKVKATNANIVTIQETHSTRRGTVIIPSEFVAFESIPKEKNGGTLIAVHETMNLKLIN